MFKSSSFLTAVRLLSNFPFLLALDKFFSIKSVLYNTLASSFMLSSWESTPLVLSFCLAFSFHSLTVLGSFKASSSHCLLFSKLLFKNDWIPISKPLNSKSILASSFFFSFLLMLLSFLISLYRCLNDSCFALALENILESSTLRPTSSFKPITLASIAAISVSLSFISSFIWSLVLCCSSKM